MRVVGRGGGWVLGVVVGVGGLIDVEKGGGRMGGVGWVLGKVWVVYVRVFRGRRVFVEIVIWC